MERIELEQEFDSSHSVIVKNEREKSVYYGDYKKSLSFIITESPLPPSPFTLLHQFFPPTEVATTMGAPVVHASSDLLVAQVNVHHVGKIVE